MNKALSLTNWDKGGNFYILNATSDNKWVGFQESVINKLQTKFENDFFLVIWSDKDKEDDFYNIPFKKVKHVFIDEHKTTGNFPDRWTAIIINDSFLMHSNSKLAIDIKADYGNLPAEYVSSSSLGDQTNFIEFFNSAIKESTNLSTEDRKKRLAKASKKPTSLAVTTIMYQRNPDVVVEVLHRANGQCENCKKSAPFLRRTDGTPYLEVHHIVPLSEDGDDTVENAIALCPNCHREKHFG